MTPRPPIRRAMPPPVPSHRTRSPCLVLGAALVAVSVVGCAGIDPFGPQPLAGAAQSAVMGRGVVTVHLAPDGVVTVSGWVEDRLSEQAVLREVADYPEVTGVVDLIRVNDFYR